MGELGDALHEVLPRVLPRDWEPVGGPGMNVDDSVAQRYRNLRQSLNVIASVERHDSGALWLHVSCSGRRIPSWRQLVEVKELFMGDRYAVQALPPRKDWVNLHETCLHLWHRLDGPTLSDGDST